MALLSILTVPDRRLKQKSVAVETVDAPIRRLMDDMLATMYAAPGIGLAAPQVGILKRVIVMDIRQRRDGTHATPQPPTPLLLANPTLIRSEGTLTWQEGCLSLPEQMADVNRSAIIEVRALNQDNQSVTIEAEGLLAVCLQHEMDHLDGILFIDHLSRLKRSMVLQKLKKNHLKTKQQG